MHKTLKFTVAAVAGFTITLAVPYEAHASTPLHRRALSTAAAQKGDPYRYGATGPNAFDCSGLMYYSYKHNGHTIPRTAQAQYNASHHVSGRTADIGTMVFFGKDPRHVTHVGIYAGKDKRGHSLIWNANTGSYRGRKVVLAPASEYATNGNHGYFGLIG